MDQKKVGAFLKQLRTQVGMTQEQLAERLGVNSRSVSRWETGRTMPDFALLIELGRLYGVTVDELLDGSRKAAPESILEGDTMEKIADYTEQEKQMLTRRLNRLLWLGSILLLVSATLQIAEVDTPFTQGVTGFSQGCALGLLLVGVLMTSRFGPRLRAAKRWFLQWNRQGS